MSRLSRRLLPSWARLSIAAGIASACGTDPEGLSRVASVVITSPAGDTDLRTLGGQLQFVAEARDQAGAQLPNAHIEWRLSGPATITSAGVLSPIRSGRVIVRALSAGVGSSPLIVTIAPRAVRIRLTPDSLMFHTSNFAQHFSAEALDSSGAGILDGVTLRISDTSIARISPPSNIYAVKDGRTEVVASADGLVASAPIVVARIPANIALSPVRLTSRTPRTLSPLVTDSAHHVIPSYPIRVESSDTTVAAVTSDGVLMPGREGRTQLRLSTGPIAITVSVEVHYVLASVQILPSHMTFYTVGRPQHARLYAQDSTGYIIGSLPDTVAGRTGQVSWHPLASYFSIAPSGEGVDVYPEYQFDFDMLHASFNGLEGYALISVWWHPVAFGLIAPQTTLPVGASATITMFVRDSAGTDLIPRAPFFWLSRDQSVARVESDFGLHDATVFALTPGTSWITMFGAGIADSVLVTVH